ncbi:unnamed protein product [Euphydryas editha]|uniref:DDE Tnp4 domain-containing protein n=1 Tax=Euphydryas editha TaxID=104508 RepID=A0AAU9TQH1_EUPED|nr:unnamed protein product [Euphydryas editha]
MDSDEEEVLLLLALIDSPVKKRIWIHDINRQHRIHGEFHTLYPRLRLDEDRFFKAFRMTTENFDEILNMIKENIIKSFTKYREPICPEERLAITLRFLASGDSFRCIANSYRVGCSTVAEIVDEVCDVIWTTLQPIYMKPPTEEMWNLTSEEFYNMWQFPNCLGSIDGKHVTIVCPPNSGSNYFCYLKKFSVVLMAIVGPHYNFLCIDVGGFGKNSDGGIFENSVMGRRFNNGTMNVPRPKLLPRTNDVTPHVLIGDEAFRLQAHVMKPFNQRVSRVDRRKEEYNKRLCRARRVVENAFGLLAQKWRIYFKPMHLKVSSAKKVIKATCVLHI